MEGMNKIDEFRRNVEKLSEEEREELAELIEEIFEMQWRPVSEQELHWVAEDLRSFGFDVDPDWLQIFSTAYLLKHLRW